MKENIKEKEEETDCYIQTVNECNGKWVSKKVPDEIRIVLNIRLKIQFCLGQIREKFGHQILFDKWTANFKLNKPRQLSLCILL